MPGKSDWIALLQRLPYFAGLDDATMQIVAASTVRRAYSAGQIILLEGEACAGLFIVQTGRVKISRSSLEGREQILHLVGPGDSFNDVPIFDGGPNPATAQAMDDSTLLIIERPTMLDLFDRHPRLARAVVQVLAARCRQLVAMVHDISLRPVTARLAGLLLDQAARPDAPPLTRAQMAARLGTVREMISRSLRELEQAGCIKLNGAQIIIVDRDGLKQRADR